MRNSAQYWSQDDEAQLLVSDGMVPTMTVPVTIERTYPYGNAAPPVTGMDPHESADTSRVTKWVLKTVTATATATAPDTSAYPIGLYTRLR
ncbi:hypothetical protein C1H76_3334 [Elsinoe australis]|uniref:Uncharacterized protein n=1 Tax=Elsinoe australis TaxID=40998 RepID=A0A4U7AZZ2_9PEZI|nr:hypothetical protein C1H76_3334 [Elsinoe australis]